ncbi:MAG: S8 family serine peptidase [Kofleriaceae bacterium]
MSAGALAACADVTDTSDPTPVGLSDPAVITTDPATKLIRHVDRIDREYIVVLRSQPRTRMAPELHAAADAELATTVDRLAATYPIAIGNRYAAALHGFGATMSEDDAIGLANDPDVEFVEENVRIQIDAVTQSPTPSWGIDRVDQAALPLDHRYVQLGQGEGATVYVIDTGLNTSHAQFTGRVLPGAYTVMDGREVEDCHGHGTHVAGTAVGSTYGIAKRASIVPVRVLDCNGAGNADDTIAGIDWVTANHRPLSVINMSLGGAASAATDAAVRNAVAAGITVVVAAGNTNVDACSQSPAREPLAITVAATDRTDTRGPYSNFGACVDVFAPGTDIVSAHAGSSVATATLTGTSMASPHVAGAAALYRAANPTATPVQVATAIISGAATNKVVDPKGSPNRLLSTKIADTRPPMVAFVSPANNSTVPNAVSVTITATDPNLESVRLVVDGAEQPPKTATPFTFEVTGLSAGPHTLEAIARDLAGESSSAAIAITVDPGESSPNPSEPQDPGGEPSEQPPGGGDPDGSDPGGDDTTEADHPSMVAGCAVGDTGDGAFALVLAAFASLRRRRRGTDRRELHTK